MHILFISDGDGKYGASQSMKQLIAQLLKDYENIEISVVLPLRVNSADYYKRLGCHTYKILYEPFYQGISDQKWKVPIKYCIRGIEYLLGRGFAAYCLAKKLDMDTVDIIHSNSSREDFSAELALKYNKPLIWHIREFGDKDYSCFSFRKNYINLMNKAAIEFIAVSDAVKKHWIKKGIDRKKIVRIYDGVDINIRNDYERNRRENKIRFLMLGCICETKGQYQIIQALDLMTENERKRLTLDFVGSGTKTHMKKLIKEVEAVGISESVKFLGYQEDFQVNIGKYDCGIMCSKSEGFGRVTLEYMMAGIPVIASNTGANMELIINKENGLLYQWNNIVDLKDKLIYALNNSSKLEMMGKMAKKYAESYFSSKRNAELVYSEYLKILK